MKEMMAAQANLTYLGASDYMQPGSIGRIGTVRAHEPRTR